MLRVSGKVDGVRLPKELFFVSRVMQSARPGLHIIGHWTYARTKPFIRLLLRAAEAGPGSLISHYHL